MIPLQHMLPAMFEGMHVDVEEVGTFRPMASYPDPRTMIRPAQPGSSIGFEFPGGIDGGNIRCPCPRRFRYSIHPKQ